MNSYELRGGAMKFTVMCLNQPVAEVKVSDDKKQVEIQKLIPDSILQPFCGKKLDTERVYQFLKGRCYEDDRADLKEILEQAGMMNNNPWEWVRITHGVTFEDTFWVRFPGETLTWEEVKPR